MNQNENRRLSTRRLPLETQDAVIAELPSGLPETLYAFPQLFIAGGFIRAVLAGEEPKDVDVFSTDLSCVERAKDFFMMQRAEALWESATPCTTTVTGPYIIPVQFVNNVAYESPLDCIEKVDFTICQAAIWREGDMWNSLCTAEFIRDAERKRLVYAAPDRVEAPGGSLWRATKFLQRGYYITQSELAKLVARCVNGQLQTKQCTHPGVDINEVFPDQIMRSFSLRGSVYGGVF